MIDKKSLEDITVSIDEDSGLSNFIKGCKKKTNDLKDNVNKFKKKQDAYLSGKGDKPIDLDPVEMFTDTGCQSVGNVTVNTSGISPDTITCECRMIGGKAIFGKEVTGGNCRTIC